MTQAFVANCDKSLDIDFLTHRLLLAESYFLICFDNELDVEERRKAHERALRALFCLADAIGDDCGAKISHCVNEV